MNNYINFIQQKVYEFNTLYLRYLNFIQHFIYFILNLLVKQKKSLQQIRKP